MLPPEPMERPCVVAIYPVSLTGYQLRLDRCGSWPEIQALLNEALCHLPRTDYAQLRTLAVDKIGRLNAASVGQQKGRWS